MNRLGHVRRVTLFVLLLLVAAAPAWAEYCKSQGSPRIPKSEIGPYGALAIGEEPMRGGAVFQYVRSSCRSRAASGT